MSQGAGARPKKTKGRYIPSRFKQAAESYSGQSSEGTCSVAIKNTTLANETRLNKKTSTPAKNNTALPNFDATILNPNMSHYDLKKDKVPVLKMKTTLNDTTVRKRPSKKLTNMSVLSVPRNVSNQSCRNLDAEIDIHYAQYQLSLLLENKARKSLLTKSKTAVEKFDEAFHYIKVLLEKHLSIKKDAHFVSFLSNLHEHLHKQEEMCLPLLELLPTLGKQCEEIAVAIDSVRHKLRVQDIVPVETGSEGEIIHIAEKISLLLKQILDSVNYVEEISSSSDSFNVFAHEAKVIVEEIKRGSELLSESRDLLLSETSLNLAPLTLEEES